MEQIKNQIYWKLFELVETDGYELDEAIKESVLYLTENLNIEKGYAEFLAEQCAAEVQIELECSPAA